MKGKQKTFLFHISQTLFTFLTKQEQSESEIFVGKITVFREGWVYERYGPETNPRPALRYTVRLLTGKDWRAYFLRNCIRMAKARSRSASLRMMENSLEVEMSSTRLIPSQARALST